MAEITQDKFNEMFKVAMNAYRTELQDNDCGNFSADGRKFVEETGLLVGGSKLPNGEANFMWQDFLTREQFATVLYRFFAALRLRLAISSAQTSGRSGRGRSPAARGSSCPPTFH